MECPNNSKHIRDIQYLHNWVGNPIALLVNHPSFEYLPPFWGPGFMNRSHTEPGFRFGYCEGPMSYVSMDDANAVPAKGPAKSRQAVDLRKCWKSIQQLCRNRPILKNHPTNPNHQPICSKVLGPLPHVEPQRMPSKKKRKCLGSKYWNPTGHSLQRTQVGYTSCWLPHTPLPNWSWRVFRTPQITGPRPAPPAPPAPRW